VRGSTPNAAASAIVNAFFTVLSQPSGLQHSLARRISFYFPNETKMTEIEFDTPILVVLGPDRTVRIVASPAEAVACLSSIYWPKVGRQHWREATHVCMQAWRGYRTAENARLALIAAAQAADVLIVGARDPAGSLLVEA
jgi:Protein of unknown function (DUF982)